MKRIVKLTALLLALILTLLPLSACKSGDREGPYPVIIIPGILGSELQKDGRTVWPFSFNGEGAMAILRAIGSLQALTVTDGVDDGVTPVRIAMTDYVDGDNVGAAGTYNTLAVALADTLGDDMVYFFGYDWRQSNLDTAAELDAYIKDVLAKTGAKKVNLIAHSMGGLVVSGYLSQHKADGCLAKIVTCGTPFTGAPGAVEMLQSGGGFLDVSQYADVMPGVLDILRSLPAVYELLPANGWNELDLTLDGRLKPDAASAPTKAYTFYETVTQKLSDVWDGVDHLNLAGTGHTTSDMDGDGTVPFRSATADGLFEACTTEYYLDHVALVTDESAIAFIAENLA